VNVDAEKAILGAILLDNTLFEAARGLAPNDFSLSSHGLIFRHISEMLNAGRSCDPVTLVQSMRTRGDLDKIGNCPVAYISDLNTGTIRYKPAVEDWVRIVRAASQSCKLLTAIEAAKARVLEGGAIGEVRSWMLSRLEEINADDSLAWRSLFHSVEEFESAPPITFAIDGFLQEHGITLFGGLAGSGKTMLKLAVVQALLNGLPLFDYFPVPRTSNKILYLIPESSLGPFVARLHLFRLENHVRAGRLLFRTLSSREDVALTDPRILQAVEGADVFLDTAIRFMSGQENDAEASRAFAQTLFALLSAGARTICGAHHSPKSSESLERLTLESTLRGSGDIGAMISTAWGLRQIDPASNRIYVENVKARDFAPPEPFIIQGRPSLDREGHFQLVAKPGEAGELRDHLNRKREKRQLAIEMHASGKSIREIAAALEVSKSTVSRWLPDAGTEHVQ
jgi:DNA-binding NarL/FixJ family response regulator